MTDHAVAADARAALGSLGLAATPHHRTTSSKESDDAILILVPGAGYAANSDELIPSGLWSTGKFAQDNGLDVGSMIKYVEWALENRIRPVVLRSHEAAEVASAFEELESTVRSAGGRRVPVVVAAHSEGGAGLVSALRDHESWTSPDDDAALRLVGIALLDSVHAAKDSPPKGSQAASFLRSGAVTNWVVSAQPLGDPKPKPWVKDGVSGGVLARSAGTADHLHVPAAAREAACAFLGARLGAASTAL